LLLLLVLLLLLLLLLLRPSHVCFQNCAAKADALTCLFLQLSHHSQCMLEATDTSGLQFMPLQKLLQQRHTWDGQAAAQRQATVSCRVYTVYTMYSMYSTP
jgi:hypothetical protein